MSRLIALLLLSGCAGGSAESSDTTGAAPCEGDRELPASVPAPTGKWTSSFAQDFYDDSCTAGGLSQSSETWINSMTIAGNAPEAVYMYFDPEATADTEIFHGVVDDGGGVTFSGTHAHPEGTLYAQFGGLLYHDQYRDLDVIDGSAFLGLDADGDGKIDCGAKGSWVALKSGS